MTKIRVLVVEDSVTIRRRLCDVLSSSADFEVAAEAADGREAIEACQRVRPDVITMDMMLPVMSGLAATEYIMAYCPTPILVVSSSFDRGELFKTYDALAAGAVEVIEKPRGDEPEGAWETQFLSLLKLVSRIRVITHPRARLAGVSLRVNDPPALDSEPPKSSRKVDLVAIGASTGGPSAIVEVLRALGPSFEPPVLIVLHLGASFAPAFEEWLSTQTERPVAYARDGERLSGLARTVRLAPPGKHLVVSGGRLFLNDTPERHSCRPSVDVLFESIAGSGDASSVIACLLTGMGRDGAAGLLRLRSAGATTIAQDEQSCVVYGMPREAVALGAAERVLPLPRIGEAIVTAARARRAPP